MAKPRQHKLAGCILFVLLVVGFYFSFKLLPPNFPLSKRAAILAFVFAASVGVSEIISRYRDEPIEACRNPFGLLYIFFNGILGVFALCIVCRYSDKFGFAAGQHAPIFLSALLAGFGSSAVMRTRLMVLKGADNKDVSVGPDIVIKILLQTVDQYVDRARAFDRLQIVSRSLPNLRTLAVKLKDFRTLADYLLTSLLAFQNLDEERKKQLQDIFSAYDKQEIPLVIKHLATGFVFLTLVGEEHFEGALDNAVKGLEELTAPVSTVQPPVVPPPVVPPPAAPPP